MAAVGSKESIPLTSEETKIAAGVSGFSQIVAGLLLLVGVLQIGLGVIGLIEGELWNFLWALIRGGFTAFLGLVMIAVSADFRFQADVPAYNAVHLKNAASNLTVFYKVLFALSIVLAIGVAIRIVVG